MPKSEIGLVLFRIICWPKTLPGYAHLISASSSWLRNRCSGGKFVVSRTGEAYTAQAIGLNRKFRPIIHKFRHAIESRYRKKTLRREDSHMFSTLRSAICISATLIVFSAFYVGATVPAVPQES